MNTIKQTAKGLLTILALLIAMINFSACSKDENPVSPGETNISGSWKGPFNHPAYYSGYLEMSVVQNNNNVTGTFHLYLSPGYSGEDYYGNVTGSPSNNGKYNLSLINTDFTYACDLTLNPDSLSGNWVSTSNGTTGTLTVIKQ
ncbi:MAG: hypothetical protein OQJ93_08130 [Ignavibacteriaceae bacterium]|nr:hypothetical protein [Ignavibacteriaceae bacterium]MCW8813468.1 hypothetical protein [Chlorobium sp.]MCW8996481.1 hypothetical protein [Psychromonas sp.]MCW8823253.1 hypothetical protein [Ignavibacteriaceae bacterium]MCW8961835.1 hypothetical protein [Ignavibacteriaceae bacterium]